MRDGALSLLNRLVDSASEAANLEEELLNLKGSIRGAWRTRSVGHSKRLHATYERKMQAREADGEGADAFAQTASRSCSARPFTEGRTRLDDCRDCRSVVV